MPSWLIWGLLLAAASALGTWLARWYAVRGNLIDQPGERRSHAVATPRGGGIAIVGVMVLAAGWLLWRDGAAMGWLIPAFLIGLLLVAGIGWWDDHRPLSPWSRLAVQALASGLLGLAAWHDSGIHAGGFLIGAAAFLSAMVLVNVWNFMDGINGLAASQAALAAAAFAWALTGPWSWLALALMAGCLGFLPFNFPKARIFLGDVGSGAIGFGLAALWVAGWHGSQVPWPLLALPLCPFLVDAGFTLAARMLAGERWWTPHVTHLYQRYAKRAGHTRVTVTYATLCCVAIALIYGGRRWTIVEALVAVVAAYAVAWIGYAGLRRGLRA